jgi:hypothetical protein
MTVFSLTEGLGLAEDGTGEFEDVDWNESE